MFLRVGRSLFSRYLQTNQSVSFVFAHNPVPIVKVLGRSSAFPVSVGGMLSGRNHAFHFGSPCLFYRRPVHQLSRHPVALSFVLRHKKSWRTLLWGILCQRLKCAPLDALLLLYCVVRAVLRRETRLHCLMSLVVFQLSDEYSCLAQAFV